jgi:hypothetical protein
MALSPNYGWSEPDNSSLVKNGAADIRTLGDAIDSSLWAVGYGQAGKNKIINGDFGIWQRGTSFSNPANGDYTTDRFKISYNGTGATRTVSQQTFTPGTAPVAGYEGQFFYRVAQTVAGTGQTFLTPVIHRIEDVRTFAGQTVTLSFWAKAGASISISGGLVQNFGSGGSGSVNTSVGTHNLTTSWQRFTATVSIPSLTGKTIGTSSFLELYFDSGSPTTVQTLDFWGFQLEYGSKATPFETATGTIQGELAACQRYFRSLGYGLMGACISATTVQLAIYHPSMRVTPTFAAPSPIQISDMISTSFTQSSTSISIIVATQEGSWLSLPNFTGMTTGRPATLNSPTGISLSAEL